MRRHGIRGQRVAELDAEVVALVHRDARLDVEQRARQLYDLPVAVHRLERVVETINTMLRLVRAVAVIMQSSLLQNTPLVHLFALQKLLSADVSLPFCEGFEWK